MFYKNKRRLTRMFILLAVMILATLSPLYAMEVEAEPGASLVLGRAVAPGGPVERQASPASARGRPPTQILLDELCVRVTQQEERHQQQTQAFQWQIHELQESNAALRTRLEERDSIFPNLMQQLEELRSQVKNIEISQPSQTEGSVRMPELTIEERAKEMRKMGLIAALTTHPPKEIDFKGTNFGDDDTSLLCPIIISGKTESVELLSFDSTLLGDKGLAELVNALMATNKYPGGSIRGTMENLKILNFRNTKISDAGIASLAQLCALGGSSGHGIMGQLRSLNFNGTKIGDVGAGALGEAFLVGKLHCQAQSWSFDNTKIGNAGVIALVQAFTKIGHNQWWFSLSFNGTDVGDEGVASLGNGFSATHMSQFPGRERSLTSLSLSYTQIGDAGLTSLAQAFTGVLELLDVSNNPNVTEKGLSFLRKSLSPLKLREDPLIPGKWNKQ